MSKLGDKNKLKIGQFGYSLDIIALDKKGPCYFDGVRYDVKAGTDIRKWAEVIVITLTPEPTVIETWGVFPLSYELAAGGYKTVGANFPLPVTAGSRAISVISIEATALGTTEIIAPSSPTAKIRVHYFLVSNKHATVADVALTFKSSPAATDLKFRMGVPADGGTVPSNIIDCNWEGATGETLYAYLTAAYATGVYFTVGYTEE